jgi:hypothetical protein
MQFSTTEVTEFTEEDHGGIPTRDGEFVVAHAL